MAKKSCHKIILISGFGTEEEGDGELLFLPGEPQLVAAVPSQGVEVGEEGGLLHVLPQEGGQGGESGEICSLD